MANYCALLSHVYHIIGVLFSHLHFINITAYLIFRISCTTFQQNATLHRHLEPSLILPGPGHPSLIWRNSLVRMLVWDHPWMSQSLSCPSLTKLISSKFGAERILFCLVCRLQIDFILLDQWTLSIPVPDSTLFGADHLSMPQSLPCPSPNLKLISSKFGVKEEFFFASH